MGDVISRKGRIAARRIVTGVQIDGAVNDQVLKAALDVAARFRGGNVVAAEGVEAREDIVVGFQYLNPETPDRDAFLAELKGLRETVAALLKEPKAKASAQAAAKSLDEAIGETQSAEPVAKRVVNRLRDTLEFLTDAGKALDAADKAGALIAKAVPVAMALYQVAEKVL